MRISVFGLGYVGCVTAACLAHIGHDVIGIDIAGFKVDALAQGKAPVIEPDLEEMIAEAVSCRRLFATQDAKEAVLGTNVSLICVGTPSNTNGSPKLDYLQRVCRDIGTSLSEKETFHVVVVRSTVLPGTVEGNLLPILEENSKKKARADFGLAMNPEFLREGSGIHDFYHPPYVLIGELDKRSGDAVEALYAPLTAAVIRTDIKTAEMAKYASNTFHALKICFANEVGVLCKTLGVDSHEVMDIFCRDIDSNLSSRYLKPGHAFGGSCLPKDVRAMLYQARNRDCELPLLQAILSSNEIHNKRVVNMIMDTGKRRLGLIGLGFKPGTDDLRESPFLDLVETLLGKGLEIRIFDEIVSLAGIFGSNKAYLETKIPQISQLLCASMEEVVIPSDIVVVAHRLNEKRERYLLALIREGQVVIDLVRFVKDRMSIRGEYHGICW